MICIGVGAIWLALIGLLKPGLQKSLVQILTCFSWLDILHLSSHLINFFARS